METGLREGEQGLYDILHPLILHWKWIAVGVVLGVAIAAIASFVLPKQYETTCVLNIGTAVDKSLEDPYTVTKIINSNSFQQSAAAKVGVTASAKELQKMVEAETDTTRWTPWVSIRVTTDDPQKAFKLANAIAEGIIQRHALFFDGKMQGYRDYQRDLEQGIAKFTEEAAILMKNLNAFRTTQHDFATELMLQNRLSDKEEQTMTMKRELRDMAIYLSEVHSRRTSLVAKPVLPKVPSKPNFELNLIVAAIVSTFLMISFVLLLEQYRKGKFGV